MLSRLVARAAPAVARRAPLALASTRPKLTCPISSSSRSEAPEMHAAQQRGAARTQQPRRGTPIEQATTATDPDDTYTLGQSAQTGGSFTELTIGDVLSRKSQYGSSLHTVRATDSVLVALQAMNHYSIGAILVTAPDDPSHIVGIFSTRDFIKYVDGDSHAQPIDVRNLRVQEMMTQDPVFAYADTNALAAMNMMNSGGFRHLPIRDRALDKPIGLVSIGDLVRSMMQDYAQKNEQLESLVNGNYSA